MLSSYQAKFDTSEINQTNLNVRAPNVKIRVLNFPKIGLMLGGGGCLMLGGDKVRLG